MRHFYQAIVSPPNVPLMTEIMRKRTELFDENGDGDGLPPDAKKMALAIMQVVNGSALVGAALKWLNHNMKKVFPANGKDIGRYIAVLSGQIMCLVDDECPALNVGEVWWCDSMHDAVLLNKSGDDAVVLSVSIRNE